MTLQSENSFAYLFRFGMMPLMLFSGTFFPLSQLPGALRLLAYATPLWHGVDLCRMLSLGHVDLPRALIHIAYLTALSAFGIWAGARTYRRRLYV
jgi:lipooligosaccharide transport system permease protein